MNTSQELKIAIEFEEACSDFQVNKLNLIYIKTQLIQKKSV